MCTFNALLLLSFRPQSASVHFTMFFRFSLQFLVFLIRTNCLAIECSNLWSRSEPLTFGVEEVSKNLLRHIGQETIQLAGLDLLILQVMNKVIRFNWVAVKILEWTSWTYFGARRIISCVLGVFIRAIFYFFVSTGIIFSRKQASVLYGLGRIFRSTAECLMKSEVGSKCMFDITEVAFEVTVEFGVCF